MIYVDRKKDQTQIYSKYFPLGIGEDNEFKDPVDLNLTNKPDPNYSVVGKIRHLSKSAAKDRINSIRMQSAKLIGQPIGGH